MRVVSVSAVLAFLLAGCGASQIVDDDVPLRPSAPIPFQGGTVAAASGATRVEIACDEGADERCDALDDDCDGRIDEGCGYGEGILSIVATWGNDADVDLVVTSEASDPLAAPEKHSGRGACGEGGEHPRIESASWAAPVTGILRVALIHVDPCLGEESDDEAQPTTGSVSIALGGETIGAFNVTLSPGATVEVATLSLSD